jgi:hypothetical protein
VLTAAPGDTSPRRCPHSIVHCTSVHPSKPDSWLLTAMLQQRWLTCDAAAQHAAEAVPLAPHHKVACTSDCRASPCFCCHYYLMKHGARA